MARRRTPQPPGSNPDVLDVHYPEEGIERLRVALEDWAGHPIDRDYAARSMHNLVGFFSVLERWAREDGLLDDLDGSAESAGGPEVPAPSTGEASAPEGPEAGS